MKKIFVFILPPIIGIVVVTMAVIFWKRIQIFVLPQESWIPLTLSEARALSCNRNGIIGKYRDRLILCEEGDKFAGQKCDDSWDCSENPGSTGYHCGQNHVCYSPAGRVIGQKVDKICEDIHGSPYRCVQ